MDKFTFYNLIYGPSTINLLGCLVIVGLTIGLAWSIRTLWRSFKRERSMWQPWLAFMTVPCYILSLCLLGMWWYEQSHHSYDVDRERADYIRNKTLEDRKSDVCSYSNGMYRALPEWEQSDSEHGGPGTGSMKCLPAIPKGKTEPVACNDNPPFASIGGNSRLRDNRECCRCPDEDTLKKRHAEIVTEFTELCKKEVAEKGWKTVWNDWNTEGWKDTTRLYTTERYGQCCKVVIAHGDRGQPGYVPVIGELTCDKIIKGLRRNRGPK